MGKITINDCVLEGDRISIKNNSIEVNGKEITAEIEERPLKVEIHGDIETLDADLIVLVNGDVGFVNCKGSVNCRDVKGNIQAGASVKAGIVKGSVWAGGSVNCERIEGDAMATITEEK